MDKKMPEVGVKYNLKGDMRRVVEVIAHFRDKIVLFGDYLNNKGQKIAEDDGPYFYESEIFLDNFEELQNQEQKLQEKEEVQATVKENLTVEKALEELKKHISFALPKGEVCWTHKRLAEVAQNLVNALEAQKASSEPNKQATSEDAAAKLVGSMDDSNIPEKGGCGIEKDTKEEKVYYSNWQKSECGRFKARTGTTSTVTLGESGKKQAEAEKEIEEESCLLNQNCYNCGAEIKLGSRYCNASCVEEWRQKQDKPKSLWKDVSELAQNPVTALPDGNFLFGEWPVLIAGKYFYLKELVDEFEEMKERVRRLENHNQKEQEFFKKQCEKLEGKGE